MVLHQKKYEIGILEIRRHIPVLYTFMNVCKTNKTNVTVFTTKELYSRLESYNFNLKQFNFIIKKDRENLSGFLKRPPIRRLPACRGRCKILWKC